MNAIQAKDEINYAKCEIKVFYSHYESLVLRKVTEDEEEFEYNNEKRQVKSGGFNPPSEVLYLTMVNCKQED